MTSQSSPRLNQMTHWFFGPLKRVKHVLASVVIASLFINLCALTVSFYVMLVYDRVVPNDAKTTLVTLTVIAVSLAVFEFTLKLLRGKFIDASGEFIDKEVGQRVFDKISRNYSLFTQKSAGSVAAAVREFEQVKDFISSASFILLVDLPFLLLFIGVLWALGGMVALVPMGVGLVLLAVSFWSFPLSKRFSHQSTAQVQSKQGLLVELVAGMETARSLPGLGHLRERWVDSVAAQAESNSRIKLVTLICNSLAQSAQTISQIGIVLVGVYQISEGAMTMGALVACVLLSGRVMNPLGQLVGLVTRLGLSLSSYKALDQIMQIEDLIEGSEGYVRNRRLEPRIELREVSFAYENANKPVFESISYAFDAQSKTAILGPFGGGKTTLFRIMGRLLTPSSGRVTVGGVDVANLHPEDLYRQVGLLTQHPVLFSGTLVENIRLGNPDATDEELVAAASMAGVDQFAWKLPEGLNTRLAERGGQLSGGERQCVCLARLILLDPPIVLLDEPTASIDSNSQKALLASLKNWLAPKTVILVTHSTTALELVDTVLTLDQGKLKIAAQRSLNGKDDKKSEARGAATQSSLEQSSETP